MSNNHYDDEVRLVTKGFIPYVTSRMKGIHEEDRLCLDLPPFRRFAVGQLPAPEENVLNATGQQQEGQQQRRIRAMTASPVIGMQFEVSESNTISVSISFSVFYRVFPEWDRLKEFLQPGSPPAPETYIGEDLDTVETTPTPNEISKEHPMVSDKATESSRGVVRLPLEYKRHDIQIPPISLAFPALSIGDRSSGEIRELNDALSQAIAQARSAVISDPDAWRFFSKEGATGALPKRNLVSEDAYRESIRQHTTAMIEPQWAATSFWTVTHISENHYRISLSVQNKSGSCGLNTAEERNFFGIDITVRLSEGCFQRIPYVAVPSDYRYERYTWGIGRQCTVTHAEDNYGEYLKADTTPQHYSMRLRSLADINCSFEHLCGNPIEAIQSLIDHLDKKIRNWMDYLATNTFSATRDRSYCERDLVYLQAERQQVALGLDCLKQDTRLMEAFQLTNEVFKRIGATRGYDSWYLFQFAFVISQIPSLAVRERNNDAELLNRLETVDILWFPTGGGKTEAYLGLLIMGAIYDRLRGRRTGTMAHMRYPLRMLSIQQTERVMTAICSTNMVLREKNLLTKEMDEISLGYFVGENNTPNRLVRLGGDPTGYPINRLCNDPESAQVYRIISRCTFPMAQGDLCYGEIEVVPNLDHVRLIHRCKKCGQELPLYITDDEIFRYCPTIVIGTGDKLAYIAFRPECRNLLVGSERRCPDHGFIGRNGCMAGPLCKRSEKSYRRVESHDHGLALIIQDEAHLLKETHGTFASHYETTIDYILRQQGLPPKIIGATATIEGFQEQIEHLYLRKGQRFPVAFYNLNATAYSEEDTEHIQRAYVGMLANYGNPETILRQALELTLDYIQRLKREPGVYRRNLGLSTFNSDADFLDWLVYYEFALAYVNRKNIGGQIEQFALNDLRARFAKRGIKDFPNAKFISGDDDFPDVATVVHRIESETNGPYEDKLHTLIATSIVSHGVDLDRLNLMIMAGLPAKTADYIQASARCGRSYVGAVFVLHNGFDLRERTLFQQFHDYHRFLYRMVEPVPINRYSENAILCTVPGLVSTLLLNFYDWDSGIQRALNGRSLFDQQTVVRAFRTTDAVPPIIERADLEKRVIEALGLPRANILAGAREYLQREAKHQVERVLISLQGAQGGKTPFAMNPSPLPSLRDVDQQIEFSLESSSASAFGAYGDF